jgi:hypothetical protein
MATYSYLKDGTPFTAASLNDRFEAFKGLAELNEASLAKGALNTVHLPSFVGVSGTAPTAAAFTTKSDSAFFDGSVSVGQGPDDVAPGETEEPTFVSADGFTINFPDDVILNSDGSTGTTALLLLGNVNVALFDGVEVWEAREDRRFDTDESPDEPTGSGLNVYGITLNEHRYAARIGFYVHYSVEGVLYEREFKESERTVSPRVTIGRYGNPWRPAGTVVGGIRPFDNIFASIMTPLRAIPGGVGTYRRPVKEQFDYRTYQDVALRTVLLPSDLVAPGTSVTIRNIRFYFHSLHSSSGNPNKFFVDRGNLTALPLKAEVA